MICIACSSSAPSAPTLVSPENESTINTTDVTLLWNGVASWGTSCAGGSNQYQVYMDTSTDPTTLVTTVGSGTTSAYESGLTRGSTYYWKVRAHNGDMWIESAVRSFTVGGGVAGTVYNDPDGVCSTSDPTNLGVSLGVTWGSNSGTVNSDGTFSFITTDLSPQTLTLTGMPSTYICSAACGACVKPGTASPSTGNNFFLTQSRAAWWQAAGAGVYAGSPGSGMTIRSLVPRTTDRLIIPGSNSVAALVRASSGTPDIGSAAKISDPNYSAVSQYKGKRMDYAFFAAHMGITSSSQDDFAGDSLGKPANDPTKDFWYQVGNATVDQPWAVAAGESYVVFVDGDLHINADITVAGGGFLAFVVNDDVIVDPAVASIQGLYVMDGTFKTESAAPTDDVALGVQGSIVTWSGVDLQRDLGDANLITPAETFQYRPDLIVNMPEKMKVFALRWQEVSPGTFGN